MPEVTVTVVGRIGQPPMLRTGSRGDWATFTVASTPRWRQGTDWVDGPTSWFDVNVDGELAHHVVDSIGRGQQVIVHGTVAVREAQQQDGGTSKYVNIKATAVGPDLRWGTARFTKTERAAAAPQQPQEPRPSGDDGWGAPGTVEPRREPVPSGWASALAAEEETPF